MRKLSWLLFLFLILIVTAASAASVQATAPGLHLPPSWTADGEQKGGSVRQCRGRGG